METTDPRPRAVGTTPTTEPKATSKKSKRKATHKEIVLPPLSERGAILVCPHSPDSALTRRIVAEANALVAQDVAVVLYCPERPAWLDARVIVHELGWPTSGSLLEQALEFADRVSRADAKTTDAARRVVAFGSEWTSVPALRQLQKLAHVDTVLSITSLESQRSDMSSELSRAIERVEHDGLQSVQRAIVSDQSVADGAVSLVGDCAFKLRHARQTFPMEAFVSNLDPGEVKARYQIGPVDPIVLFIGDMNHAHGPDILVRAMPALLRNHGRLRAVFVGDGELLWPVRVQARYMLLEHAVRLLGDRRGQELHELIAAADIVVVPSRERTEDWQILAGWAASRPVVATHQVAANLCGHEDNAVLVYPNPHSCVWGVERVLYDGELQGKLGERGRQSLEERFGWTAVGTELVGLIDELTHDGGSIARQHSGAVQAGQDVRA